MIGAEIMGVDADEIIPVIRDEEYRGMNVLGRSRTVVEDLGFSQIEPLRSAIPSILQLQPKQAEFQKAKTLGFRFLTEFMAISPSATEIFSRKPKKGVSGTSLIE